MPVLGTVCGSTLRSATKPSGDRDLPRDDEHGLPTIVDTLAKTVEALHAQISSQLLQVEATVVDTNAKVDLLLQRSENIKTATLEDSVATLADSTGERPPSALKRAVGMVTFQEDSLEPFREVTFNEIISHQQGQAEQDAPRVMKRMDSFGTVSTKSSGNSSAREMERLRQLVQLYRASSTRSPWALSVWQCLEERRSSSAALWYSNFVPIFIILSVVMSFLQTIEDWALPATTNETIQMSFEIAFCAELITRFLVCPDRILFWISFFNIVDFVSVLPLVLRIVIWYNDSGAHVEVIDTVLFTVPFLRLMKILRRFHKFLLLIEAFKNAFEALPVLLYTLLLLALSFAYLIFFFESRDLVPSLSTALWFVFTTMTTVGYGDIVPETVGGYLVTGLLMIFSVLYMAIPIGIVGYSFNYIWVDRDRLLLTTAVKERCSTACFSEDLIRHIFRVFAKDDANELDDDCLQLNLPSFGKMLRVLHVTNISDDRIVKLFNILDKDCGGTISCEEFMDSLFPSYSFQMVQQES